MVRRVDGGVLSPAELLGYSYEERERAEPHFDSIRLSLKILEAIRTLIYVDKVLYNRLCLQAAYDAHGTIDGTTVESLSLEMFKYLDTVDLDAYDTLESRAIREQYPWHRTPIRRILEENFEGLARHRYRLNARGKNICDNNIFDYLKMSNLIEQVSSPIENQDTKVVILLRWIQQNDHLLTRSYDRNANELSYETYNEPFPTILNEDRDRLMVILWSYGFIMDQDRRLVVSPSGRQVLDLYAGEQK
jgi:hypothetical protein